MKKSDVLRILVITLLLLPASLSGQNEVVISNGILRLKQDLNRGGAISYLSEDRKDRNLVNIYDEGRYIQQSYYAGVRVNRQSEGQSKAWSPWNWNPIQGGNYARRGARILRHAETDTSIYIACKPMLWDMDNAEADALMEQWTELKGNVVKVRNRIVVHSIDSVFRPWKKNDQEIPAVYPISALCCLHAYTGAAPWTNDTVSHLEVVELREDMKDSFWGRYPDVSEKWMAFTDKSGWGMAVYSPDATRFLAGRYTPDMTGEEKSLATSYLAPLCTARIKPGTVMQYEYYLIVGDIGQIRQTIYKLKNNIN